MVQKRKELHIPKEFMEPEWKEDKVVIKRLKLGESLRMQDRASDIRISDAGMAGKVSQEVAMIEMLSMSVIEAPWVMPKEIKDRRSIIAELDSGLGMWLLIECKNFNSINLKKKGGLENSEEKAK